MAANRADGFAGAISRIWARGGVLGCEFSLIASEFLIGFVWYMASGLEYRTAAICTHDSELCFFPTTSANVL